MSQLHLVHLPMSSHGLGTWAAVRRYGMTSWKNKKGQRVISRFDEGRALHHLLTELFGKRAIHPFRAFWAPDKRHLDVYGYSSCDAPSLVLIAQEVGLPDALAVCEVDKIRSKQMPNEWSVGRRLAFETRVRPVSRLKDDLPPFRSGAEIDTFLVEAMRRFPGPVTSGTGMLQAGRTREEVYTDWLADRLGDSVELCSGTRLSRFERVRVAREGCSPEGPDAVLRGEFVIKDVAAFTKAVTNGVGRHKAYGYGMLLLRPAQMG